MANELPDSESKKQDRVRCDYCGRIGRRLIVLTDAPNVHDGNYCEECVAKIMGIDNEQ